MPDIAPPTPASPGLPPDEAVVTRPVWCPQCGYSVLGLRTSGVCPECGCPVERALKGNLLQFAAPEYVRMLARGALLAALGAFASLIAALGVPAATVAVALYGLRPWMPQVEAIGGALSLVAAGVGLLGWWLLSAPDPGWRGVDESLSARKLVRAAVVVQAITATCSTLLPLLVSQGFIQPGPGRVDAVSAAKIGTLIAGSIAWLVAFFASMQFLQRLAGRIPDESLRTSAMQFMWVGPILYVLLIPCLLVGPIIATILYIMILSEARSKIARVLRGIAP
ncbi:MAG: hypothetical protein AB7K52_12100 [Phycisphaerales bacterium]